MYHDERIVQKPENLAISGWHLYRSVWKTQSIRTKQYKLVSFGKIVHYDILNGSKNENASEDLQNER
jgi:hypothetical protein